MIEGSAENDALISLLGWYLAMGVDGVVDDAPHDRFAARSPPVSAPLVTQERGAPQERGANQERIAAPDMPLPSDALVQNAQEKAQSAGDLAALETALATLPGLSLATTARMIAASGPAEAELLIWGGAPDTDDERSGEMFAGPAGRLLDAMLRAIGLTRAAVHLAYLVPWRPPGNRPPTPLELALCLPFARRRIALMKPHVMLCLGERAAQPLLASTEPIGRLRGRWLSYADEAEARKLLVTFSPAYCLSQPLQKRRVWADLQMVAQALEDGGARSRS